jgi:hypothetical protein
VAVLGNQIRVAVGVGVSVKGVGVSVSKAEAAGWQAERMTRQRQRNAVIDPALFREVLLCMASIILLSDKSYRIKGQVIRKLNNVIIQID